MKIFSKILLLVFAIIFVVACNEGIDPISPVESGSDELAPSININSPTAGELIRVQENKALYIDMEVVDDIELASVKIVLDDAEIAQLSSFKDYRRYAQAFPCQDKLENGSHTLKVIATDLTGKTTESQVVSFDLLNVIEFTPRFGEIFYMNFDDSYINMATSMEANVVGNPTFAEGKKGKAYAGAADSYVSFSTAGLLHEEFSAAFWYKVDANPDRSGILVVGPPDTNNPSAMNNRTSGFRLFREGDATNQIIKLNVGNGSFDGWFDGSAAATINAAESEWVHIAFTIATNYVTVYINGDIVAEGDFGPVDWTGCDILSIGSGAPRFTEWDHKSDYSLYDELMIFDKALSQEEINTIIDSE